MHLFLHLILDVAIDNPGTSAVTRTLSVPTGIKVVACVGVHMTTVTTGFNAVRIYDLDLTAAAAAVANAISYMGGTSSKGAPVEVMTNTSGQIGSRMESSAVGITLYIGTIGWIDRRGRDA
jgi:hypothetical protein